MIGGLQHAVVFREERIVATSSHFDAFALPWCSHTTTNPSHPSGQTWQPCHSFKWLGHLVRLSTPMLCNRTKIIGFRIAFQLMRGLQHNAIAPAFFIQLVLPMVDIPERMHVNQGHLWRPISNQSQRGLMYSKSRIGAWTDKLTGDQNDGQNSQRMVKL